jgi:hypothetical protein
MPGVTFKGLRIQEDPSKGLTNIESSYGDIKSGRVMPGMASSERTGTKWQDSHFAQPKVAQRAKCMDALSEPYSPRTVI